MSAAEAAFTDGAHPDKPAGWRVAVKWDSGNLYEGVVTTVEDGKARIHYDDGDRDLEPLGSGRISWLRKESVGALQLAKQVRRAWRGKPEETTEVSATAQLVNMLVAAGVEPKADLAALLTSTESQAGTGRDPSDVPPPTILSELDLTAASGLDSKDHSAPVSMGDTHGTSFSDTALTSVDADETSGSEEESDAESEEESDSEGDSEEESETESESDYSDTTASEDSSEEDASDGEGGGKDAEDADETSVHDMILRMRRPARSGRAVKVKWVWCEGGTPEHRSKGAAQALPVKKGTLCEVDGVDVVCRLANDAFGDRTASGQGGKAGAGDSGSQDIYLAYFDEDGDLICVDSNEDVQLMYASYFRLLAESPAGAKTKPHFRIMVSDCPFGSATPVPQPSLEPQTPTETQPSSAAATAGPQGSVQDWRVGKLLGSGSFGKVYAGLDENTGQNIAIKAIRLPDSMVSEFLMKAGSSTTSSHAAADLTAVEGSADFDDTPAPSPEAGTVDSIVREIQLMEGLQHPNIVQYLGSSFLVKQQKLLIFLEFAAGGSLLSVLQQFGSKHVGQGLPAALVARYARDMTRGLAYLHSHQVVHRDLKPANVLLHEGKAKLADFGCSKIATESAVQTSSAVGTALYCAPELLSDCPTYGCASDVWSLGITTAQLLHGTLPWGGNIAHAVYKACFSEDLPDLPADVPQAAVSFISDCLRRSAKDRPTAEALLHHAFLQVDDAAAAKHLWK